MKRRIWVASNFEGPYTLHENGQIERKHVAPSDSWVITGAIELNNFGHMVRRYTLADVVQNQDIPWFHKNGKQRTHLTDLDHGTHRMWGTQHQVI